MLLCCVVNLHVSHIYFSKQLHTLLTKEGKEIYVISLSLLFLKKKFYLI